MGKYTVVVDPGHYENANPYPAAKGYYEGTQMYKLGTYLKAMLESSGVDVVITRNNIKENPDLSVRGKMAGSHNANLFISLHSDAIGSYVSESAKGVTVFYSYKANAAMKNFATKLASEMSTLLGTTNRQAQTRLGDNGDWYGVIRSSAASGCTSACLIEHGFHTNSSDVKKLISDEWLKKIATKECDLICEFLGTVSKASSVKIGSSTVGNASNISSTEKYALYCKVPSYTTAANAIAGDSSVTKATLNAGEYYIYRNYQGMLNLTKTVGVPGGWINPKDNIKAAAPSASTTISEEKYEVLTEINKYSTAQDATNRTNAVKTKLAAGVYYIYKKSGKVLNVSKTVGTVGSWINPEENIISKCEIAVGDVIVFSNDNITAYYGGKNYPTVVPASVIAKVNTAHDYTVSSIRKGTHGYECYVTKLKVYILANCLKKYTAVKDTDAKPSEPSNIIDYTGVDIDKLSNELKKTLTNEKYAPIFEAIKDGTMPNFLIDIINNLLSDDTYIDTSTDLETIISKTVIPAVKAAKFIKKHNPDFDEKIAYAFMKIGPIYGVAGDKALCQSIVETGWFKFVGSAVKASQHNYCGLGVTTNGVTGCSFATIEQGVEAQIQHLYAYATKNDIPKGRTLYDPRFKYVARGTAPRWVDLDGKWCAEGSAYGKTILGIYEDMAKFTD